MGHKIDSFGTRSLTVFLDEDGCEIFVMARRNGGSPEGHGVELSNYLAGKRVSGDIPLHKFNAIEYGIRPDFHGPRCMAASTLSHFKNSPGGVYLYPAGTRGWSEEYVYYVSCSLDKEPLISIHDKEDNFLMESPAVAMKTCTARLQTFTHGANDDQR